MADVADITDYVANGSFASLRENVTYKSEKDYAILVRLADYSNGFDDSKYVYIDKHSYDFLAKSSLQGGEIIMSNVGSVGKLFICPDLGMPMSLAPNTIVIKTEYNRFYYYLLSSTHYQNQIQSITSKTALPKFNKTSFKKIEVSIPPLEKQERIVAELDLLTGIIDKQKQQLKELDTLAQSIFYDMFGNPVENDKGWEKKQIGKICTSKKQIQRASKRFKDSDIIRYIDISSIDNINNVMTSTTSYGFGDAPSRAQQVVELGDVLISLVRPNLNNVAMVSEDGTDLVASSGFCVLRANCEIVKEFLFYSVKMKCFTDYLMQRVSGANYPAVREDDITGYNIILPPLELQESFAKKIQAIESQKQSINRSIAESQKIFDYTMDKYFG